MLVKNWIISPEFRGENTKYLSCHQLEFIYINSKVNRWFGIRIAVPHFITIPFRRGSQISKPPGPKSPINQADSTPLNRMRKSNWMDHFPQILRVKNSRKETVETTPPSYFFSGTMYIICVRPPPITMPVTTGMITTLNPPKSKSNNSEWYVVFWPANASPKNPPKCCTKCLI